MNQDDRVLFHMWAGWRDFLIKQQVFYVKQSDMRLLKQFDDIEANVEEFELELLFKGNKAGYDGINEPAAIYEEIFETGIEFHELLYEMKVQTYLSLAAGMYHTWDKNLREWVCQEVKHWAPSEHLINKVWSVNIGEVFDLLESFSWQVKDTAYFQKIDDLRVLVNVYKHGDGSSFAQLKNNCPQYFSDFYSNLNSDGFNLDFIDYKNLEISREHLNEFSDAIIEFWKAVPERVFASQINAFPNWFERAAEPEN